MEKEIIRFEEFSLPVKYYYLNMSRGNVYRGMHSHAAVEIVKVKSGELICYINNETLHLHSGEVVFINGNIGHRLVSDNAEIYYFHIDVNFFVENTNDGEFSKLYEFISHTKTKPYLIFINNKEIQDILQKIDERYYENQISSRWYIKAHIYELIAFMYSQSFIATPIISKKQIEKIKAVVRYINANFKAPIMLDDICDEVNYNRYSLCHYFKSVTGATIFDYINFLRVSYSVEMLRQKGDSILDIAIEIGFSSPTYFNRVFKSVMGCSPSVYRKFF